MDIPTYIIFFSFLASVLTFSILKLFKVPKMKLGFILSLFFLGVWVFITACGEFIYNWAGNGDCSRYLGCVTGFMGYDAFEHFFFGLMFALVIIWSCERFSKQSVLYSEFWKRALIVIALVVLSGVLWEIIECTHDAIRVNIFHESLHNISLHINLLDQPTNIDTMGDLSSGLSGSIVGILLLL